MANVICHQHNAEKVRPGDTVRGPLGEPMTVDFTAYGWKGAAVWTREEGGPSMRWAASEVGCYVTSRDDD